jgi:hypothetical protein
MVRREDSDGVGFVKPGDVVKIALLAKGMFNIVVHDDVGRTAENGSTLTEFRHDAIATVLIFGGFKHDAELVRGGKSYCLYSNQSEVQILSESP